MELHKIDLGIGDPPSLGISLVALVCGLLQIVTWSLPGIGFLALISPSLAFAAVFAVRYWYQGKDPYVVWNRRYHRSVAAYNRMLDRWFVYQEGTLHGFLDRVPDEERLRKLLLGVQQELFNSRQNYNRCLSRRAALTRVRRMARQQPARASMSDALDGLRSADVALSEAFANVHERADLPIAPIRVEEAMREVDEAMTRLPNRATAAH